MNADMSLELDWDKMHGEIPAIVQDAQAGTVLMLGYMNREALAATQASGRVTFWSRSKQRLWTKGETSGHYLQVRDITADCDADALLISAQPAGPVCHRGTQSCFQVPGAAPVPAEIGDDDPLCLAGAATVSAGTPELFLTKLEQIIARRSRERPSGSYTAGLLEQGVRRIAQKVGEEGVELALAAVSQPEADIIAETADLIFHTLVLLHAKGVSLAQVSDELKVRHGASP